MSSHTSDLSSFVWYYTSNAHGTDRCRSEHNTACLGTRWAHPGPSLDLSESPGFLELSSALLPPHARPEEPQRRTALLTSQCPFPKPTIFLDPDLDLVGMLTAFQYAPIVCVYVAWRSKFKPKRFRARRSLNPACCVPGLIDRTLSACSIS